MLNIYHDFYGNQAAIRTAKSGGARLTIRGSGAKLIYAKTYKTRRGARIAMGRLSDGWYPVGATKGVAQCPARG